MENYFDFLPEEILIEVFSFLEFKDQDVLRLVCLRLKRLKLSFRHLIIFNLDLKTSCSTQNLSIQKES